MTPAATAAGGIKKLCYADNAPRSTRSSGRLATGERESEERESERRGGGVDGKGERGKEGARQSFCTCSQVFSWPEPRLRGLHVFLVKCLCH